MDEEEYYFYDNINNKTDVVITAIEEPRCLYQDLRKTMPQIHLL